MLNNTNNQINKNIIRLEKDKLHPLDHGHIVYKIKCNQCRMSYIGQSGRSGHLRKYEHGQESANSDGNSVLFQHFDETGHTLDLKNPFILDTEVSQFKSEFSEMLHRDSTDFTLNRKTDIHKLIPFLSKFKAFSP